MGQINVITSDSSEFFETFNKGNINIISKIPKTKKQPSKTKKKEEKEEPLVPVNKVIEPAPLPKLKPRKKTPAVEEIKEAEPKISEITSQKHDKIKGCIPKLTEIMEKAEMQKYVRPVANIIAETSDVEEFKKTCTEYLPPKAMPTIIEIIVPEYESLKAII